jgi:epoxyqueuosine reductase
VTLVRRVLHETVKARARALGFDRVAIGPAERPEHAAAFARWLDAGHAGTMDYLARTRDDREDPERLLPGCRSVVAVALAYGGGGDDGDWAPVARYARGRDYHDVMRPRLQALCRAIEEAAGSGVRTRAAVDTSAVLERDLAARAGLGWIGKNTNLLAPGLGSTFFIGIVLTTAEMDADERVADRCGTCTACLAACPTQAFVEPYVLDARRCISYLTIEHRGDIDEPLRPALRDWLFGCDVCQDVCPWNRRIENMGGLNGPPNHPDAPHVPAKPGRSSTPREAALAPGEPLGAIDALLALDEAGFRKRFRATALWRARRSGVLRNAALFLGARRESSARPALDQALHDGSAEVRQAAAWALARLAGRPSPP